MFHSGLFAIQHLFNTWLEASLDNLIFLFDHWFLVRDIVKYHIGEFFANNLVPYQSPINSINWLHIQNNLDNWMGNLIKIAALNGIILSFEIPKNEFNFSHNIFNNIDNVSSFNIASIFWDNYYIANNNKGHQID